MMVQVEQELGDTVSVTQKTMVNFIIISRSQALLAQELEQLKSENYDLIKALKRPELFALKWTDVDFDSKTISVSLARVMSLVGHSQLKTTNGYLRKAGVDVQGGADKLGYKLPDLSGAKILSLVK